MAFLAVTEEFCKARTIKSVQIALQNSRRVPYSFLYKRINKKEKRIKKKNRKRRL